MEGTTAQKSLFIVLLGLVALMVVFSLMATQNLGREGYNQCIQDECDKRGQEYCQKFRVANNCCQGAGGQLSISGNERVCVFE